MTLFACNRKMANSLMDEIPRKVLIITSVVPEGEIIEVDAEAFEKFLAEKGTITQ